jgi:Ca-activated chloride channel homolog
LLIPASLFSQTNNELIKKGNELYNEKKYSEAAGNYKKVTDKIPADATAQYNLGNALYKDNNTAGAIKAYEQSILFSKNNEDKAEAWYNKGVLLQNDKKLAECIDAYKSALKLNPADEDARLNLQKALKEQKQQEAKKESQQKKQNKKQEQQKQQQPKPQPQQSKMTKKEAEEKLKALLQQEKNLQDKLKKVDASSPEKPEKDW